MMGLRCCQFKALTAVERVCWVQLVPWALVAADTAAQRLAAVRQTTLPLASQPTITDAAHRAVSQACKVMRAASLRVSACRVPRRLRAGQVRKEQRIQPCLAEALRQTEAASSLVKSSIIPRVLASAAHNCEPLRVARRPPQTQGGDPGIRAQTVDASIQSAQVSIARACTCPKMVEAAAVEEAVETVDWERDCGVWTVSVVAMPGVVVKQFLVDNERRACMQSARTGLRCAVLKLITLAQGVHQRRRGRQAAIDPTHSARIATIRHRARQAADLQARRCKLALASGNLSTSNIPCRSRAAPMHQIWVEGHHRLNSACPMASLAHISR